MRLADSPSGSSLALPAVCAAGAVVSLVALARVDAAVVQAVASAAALVLAGLAALGAKAAARPAPVRVRSRK